MRLQRQGGIVYVILKDMSRISVGSKSENNNSTIQAGRTIRILVLLTGGTIGSRICDSVINVDADSSYLLIHMYDEWRKNRYITLVTDSELKDSESTNLRTADSESTDIESMYPQIEFVVHNPINILSENLQPSDWEVLYREIKEALINYDGIIITHGSDTLSYTAAFVGFSFSNANIPIVLTAANYPLEDERSVGLRNFIAAVEYISGAALDISGATLDIGGAALDIGGATLGEETEVPKADDTTSNIRLYNIPCVIYENDLGVMEVFEATKLRPADSYRDQFSSFDGRPLGTMVDGKFKPIVQTKKEYTKNIDKISDKITDKISDGTLDETSVNVFCYDNTDFAFTNQIGLLTPYPGFRYDTVMLSEEMKAILINAYHSGTVCTEGEGTNINCLLSRCESRGIDVYICSFKDVSAAQYASVAGLLGESVIGLENISPEAAYVKLLLEYNQNK